ncbi:MAG: phosphate regulon transcriptional regulator PhoB [Paracoccaceae bacterium]|nr:phosphate regulon transcriptional regulator PhoB [Paracoccaceae bacterium]
MASSGAQILVVEDETAQREVIAYNLRKEGYDVRTALDGDEAELELAEEVPDLILLDWMMPGASGLELARRIRARSETREIPIIMLTARGEEEDLIRGLDVGADDYITKPYSVSELLARVRSLLRRSKSGGADTICVGEIEMNVETHRVYVSGKEAKLGPLEFKLLQTFLERPGRVFERDHLLDKIWGRSAYVDSRTVDVHVGRMRKSLGEEAASQIRTVRGKGYALG